MKQIERRPVQGRGEKLFKTWHRVTARSNDPFKGGVVQKPYGPATQGTMIRAHVPEKSMVTELIDEADLTEVESYPPVFLF